MSIVHRMCGGRESSLDLSVVEKTLQHQNSRRFGPFLRCRSCGRRGRGRGIRVEPAVRIRPGGRCRRKGDVVTNLKLPGKASLHHPSRVWY
jgi:hypothetical protein